MNTWNESGKQELLGFIREKSHDIEKVVIPKPPYVLLGTGEEVEASLVIHLISGELKVISSQQDAEMVLNDGILHEMNIKIELGKGP
jgi:hypothetical protein